MHNKFVLLWFQIWFVLVFLITFNEPNLVHNIALRWSRLLFRLKSDVSISCTETIFRDSQKMVFVQETGTSDLNLNNDLDERETLLSAQPGFKPFARPCSCITADSILIKV